MRNAPGVAVAFFFLVTISSADAFGGGATRKCLDGADPWDVQVEITWRDSICARDAHLLALEAGDPWTLASIGSRAPSDGTTPWNFGGDPTIPLPRLLTPTIDQRDPWARLRPSVPFLRWPSARGALAFRERR